MTDESKLDFTRPLRTVKDHIRVVRVLCTDGPEPYPAVAYLEDRDHPCSWTLEGKCFASGSISASDLEYAPEKISGWVNVYRTRILLRISSSIYGSRESALSNRTHNGEEEYLGTMYIEGEPKP